VCRSAIFGKEYFEVKKKNGCSPFETMVAYLGGSAFQTVIDNPVTAYRQLVQQYAKVRQSKERSDSESTTPSIT